MNVVITKNVLTAIPRKHKIGLLIFNTAILIGKSKSCGIEITILSKRYDPDKFNGIKFVWFRIKRWEEGVVECG